MLRGKNLPPRFLGEAVSTATCVLNCCPTKKLQDCTPEEAWTEIKPMVHHLRVLGSLAYEHVPEEQRKKFDDRSDTFIFVGYHPTGAYKLYNPITNKVVTSKDVFIDESAEWKWQTKDNSNIMCILEDVVERNKGKKSVTKKFAEIRRSQQVRFPSTRLEERELFIDSEVTDSGEFSHFAFYAGTEPISWEQALSINEWKNAMVEELKAIKRNRT